MNVSGVSSAAGSTGVDRGAKPPTEITKAGLEDMRDRIEARGGTVPAGLDTLIQKFDEAAGSSGTMTVDQFKAFAKENDVTIPDPPKPGRAGRPPAGGPPRSGGPEGARKTSGTTSASASSSSTSSSSSDVTNLSESELMTRAAQGDMQAIRELERRTAARKTEDDGVGQNVDKYM